MTGQYSLLTEILLGLYWKQANCWALPIVPMAHYSETPIKWQMFYWPRAHMFDSLLKLSWPYWNWSYLPWISQFIWMCRKEQSQVKSAVMVVIINTWLRLGGRSHLVGLGKKSWLVLKLVRLLCQISYRCRLVIPLWVFAEKCSRFSILRFPVNILSYAKCLLAPTSHWRDIYKVV